MKPHYDIVTIGSATVDYFADTDSELINIATRTSSEELLAFPLGGKVLIKELNITTGGGGTNSAVAFSHLGFRTAYLGKLGDDPSARLVLDKLAREGVDFLGAQAGQTGVSFILNSIEDDRTILAYKGANDFLQPEDIQPFEAPWYYVSSMMGKSFETVAELVTHCGCRVTFNPSSYQAAMGYEALKSLLDNVDVFIVNREEACQFMGRDPAEQSDMNAFIRGIDFVAGQTVVITDAENGAWVRQGDTVIHGKASDNLAIVETTGSGDAFGATFTAALMRDLPLDRALDYAMTNAESVIQHKGAKEKLLTWDALTGQVKGSRRQVETLA